MPNILTDADKALENCRLYAARHRSEEWAKAILRFCAEAGVTGSPLRALPTQVEQKAVAHVSPFMLEQIKKARGAGQQSVEVVLGVAPSSQSTPLYASPIPAAPAAPHWRPMTDAPRDGTPVLLCPKLSNDACELKHPFVGRWDESCNGWNFAAPVGYGGIPDDKLRGWRQLSDVAAAPAAPAGMAPSELRQIGEKLTVMLASSTALVDGMGNVHGYKIKTGALHSILGILASAGCPAVVPAVARREVELAASPSAQAAPARGAMTGEELRQLELSLRKYVDGDRYDLSLLEFARGIERFHGIGTTAPAGGEG